MAKGELITYVDVKNSPGFNPSNEQRIQVEQMISLGVSLKEVSLILRIEEDLLKKYYSYEIDTAQARVNQKVAEVALKSALSGDTDMVKFWLSRRAGWKEVKTTEIVGDKSKPIMFKEVKDNFLAAIDAEIVNETYE